MSLQDRVVAEAGQDIDGIQYAGIYDMDRGAEYMFAAARMEDGTYQVAFESGDHVEVSREELELFAEGLAKVLSF